MENENKTAISLAKMPITVAQQYLLNKIVDTINEAKLHPVILMPVIEELYMSTKNALNEIRQKEKAEYEQQISESNNNNESK